MHGDDAYQVAVGPIHAGVIESGHFRFHVVGDRILHLDARLFYKHRGLERAAEGRTLDDGLAYAQRACAACAVSNSVAYAHACEEALGAASRRASSRASRTILLELERIWNHLNDIAAVCAGVGLAAGNTFFAALTERARRLNERLTGHRFLFDTVQVGGSALALDAHAGRAPRARSSPRSRPTRRRGWRELALQRARSRTACPTSASSRADDARALGAVGPAARASGLADDARAHADRLAYDGFAPVAPRRAAGDVQARLEQRAVELLQTFDAPRRAARPADRAGRRRRRTARARPSASAGSRARAARRSASSSTTDGRIERLHLRTGSYANWPVVAHAAAGNLLPDFPLINKSFELCYACADR